MVSLGKEEFGVLMYAAYDILFVIPSNIKKVGGYKHFDFDGKTEIKLFLDDDDGLILKPIPDECRNVLKSCSEVLCVEVAHNQIITEYRIKRKM